MGIDHEYYKRTLGSWANQMVYRFGVAEVYLVGSTANPDTNDPTDVDVSVVLPNEVFKSRYGLDKDEFWAWNVYTWPWPVKMERWGREVAKLALGLQCMVPGRPVDLKVQAADHVRRHGQDGRPRIRLDTIGPNQEAER